MTYTTIQDRSRGGRGIRGRGRLAIVACTLVVSSLVFTASASAWCRTYNASNQSNFNGTSIAQGNAIWFNGVASFGGAFDGQVIQFWNQNITLKVSGKSYTIPLPASQVTFSSSVSKADVQFFPNGIGGIYWFITVPVTSKNVFIGGDMVRLGTWKLPTTNGLPGGANPVTWNIGQIASGTTAGNASSFSMQWKWAAAVYKNPVLNSSLLDVTGLDNSLHAGTPVNVKNNVIGGARGGGGSNFTGSYSGTKSFSCIDP